MASHPASPRPPHGRSARFDARRAMRCPGPATSRRRRCAVSPGRASRPPRHRAIRRRFHRPVRGRWRPAHRAGRRIHGCAPPHAPASTATRAIASRGRESPPGAARPSRNADPRWPNRGSDRVRSRPRTHEARPARPRAPAVRPCLRRDAAGPGFPPDLLHRLPAAGSAGPSRRDRPWSGRCTGRPRPRGCARTPRSGRRAPPLRRCARPRPPSDPRPGP